MQPDYLHSTDMMAGGFANFLFSTTGIVCMVILILAIIATVAFSSMKWVWLTLLLYISTLGILRTDWGFTSSMLPPFEQMAVFRVPLVWGLMLLLLIPTFMGEGGSAGLSAPLLFLFLLEMYIQSILTLRGVTSRGVLGAVNFAVLFIIVGIGLTRWIRRSTDAYRFLHVVLWTMFLTLGGTVVNILFHRSGVILNGRLIGTTDNPQRLAAFIALTVPTCCALVIRRGRNVTRLLAGVLAALAFILLLWTGSRGGMMATILGVVVYFRRRMGQAFVVVCTVGMVTLLGLQFFGDALQVSGRFFWTGNTRAEVWNGMWDAFMRNPLFGAEIGGYSESSYLAIAAGYGLCGLFFLSMFMLFVVRALIRIRARRASLGEDAGLADATLATISVMLFLSIFDAHLLGTVIFPIFMLYAILGFGQAILNPGFLSEQPGLDPYAGPEQYLDGFAEWSDEAAYTNDGTVVFDYGDVEGHLETNH